MTYIARRVFLLIATITLLFCSCSDITPIWKDEYKLQNFTLYTNEPCQYKVVIGPEYDQTHAKLELTITYYNKISRNDIPLNIYLEQDSTHQILEYASVVPLKKDGEWLGIPIEGKEYDLILSHDVIDDITLQKGSYTLRVFANELEVTSGEIEGVMQIDARFYSISAD